MNNETLKEKLKKYAELKEQISLLKERSKPLKKQIEKELEEKELDKVETDFGDFTMTERTYYSYSDEVDSLKTKLKNKKKEEKESGKAEEEIRKYLRFTKND